MDYNKENMIEFISGQRTATVSFTNRRHINRIKKLYEEKKDEFKYFAENKDGSICAKIPMKWIKINPGGKRSHTMTEEQREAAKERLQNYWKQKKQ